MAKSKVVMPDLRNATPGGIVDMCGSDNEQLNALKKTTDYMKVALKARLEPEHWTIKDREAIVRGEKWICHLSLQGRSGFSQEKAKTLMSEEDFNSCFVTTESMYTRFTKLEIPGEGDKL